MATALEKIGELLVQKGLLTREQLEACIREVRDSQGSGKPLLLSEVIVSKGYADRVSLTQTVAKLADVKFRCSKCRTPYTIRSPKIDAAYSCKRCGEPLETEDVLPSQRPAPAAVSVPKPTGPPAEVAEAAKDPKRVMGKYTLVQELGRGGMAVVYKAWDDQLDQYVALKLIRTQDIGLSDQPEDETVQEFLREARTAVKLQHPNIVRVYELGRHGDRYFLSMEYVRGKNLFELLRHPRDSRTLPFYSDMKRLLGYLRDVAQALDYSHHRQPPIVHRDIKPQNILVEEGGRVCVVDFGLAKELKDAGKLTRSGIAKGTPCYMAPEQATGKPIDGRTDVYALGAILYECLAGQPPFTGPSEREILNKIIGDEPVPPSALLKSRGILAPHLPDLEQICLKALEKPKEKRYRSAGEFAAELTRFLEGQSVEARPVRGVERSWRWLMKRKAVAISTSAAVLMSIVALVAVFRGKEERIVERVKVVPEIDPARKAALEAIDRLEAEFRFDAAARACEELLPKTTEEGQRSALKQRRDDFRLQAVFLQGLARRIDSSLPVQPNFKLLGEPPTEIRFLRADPESLRVVRQGRPASISWSRVDPHQMLDLTKLAWPDMDARSTLALGVWCLRRGMSEEATALFTRPGAGATALESRRYQEELKAKETKPDLNETQQVTRLVKEAEAALAKEDLVIARARFERALILTKDDPRVLAGLAKIAEIEKTKESATAAAEPQAPPTEPPPAAAAEPGKPAEMKLPETQIVGAFAAIHLKFAQALRRGDLSGAAEQWQAAQKTLGSRAVDFPRVPGLPDLQQARPLLDDVEAWLAADKGGDELALRQVFALRDLLVLAQAYVELDAAVERLIKNKTVVSLYSLDLGKEKKGTLERSKSKLFFNETVQVEGQKGTIGHPILLRGEEGKALPAWELANLLSVDRGATGSTDVNRRLGEVLLVSYGSATPLLKPIEELQKAVAGKPEARRMRLIDYLECRRDPITLKMDLLSADLRGKWSRKGGMVEIDDKGLLLKAGQDVLSAFEGLWLQPGMRVEMTIRVEKSDAPDQGELNLGLMNLNAGTGWEWVEMANFFPNSKPADMSFLDLTGKSSEAKFVAFPYQPGESFDLVLDYTAASTTVTAAGTRIGTLAYKAPARRLLIVCSRRLQVRFSRIVLRGIPEAAAQGTVAPDAGKADEFVVRGIEKFNARDYKGAIAEFSGALARNPVDPALVYILRGNAYLELNEQSSGQADMTEAIRLGGKTNTAGAYVGLGRIRLANRDYLQSITHFTEALAQSPQFAHALRLRSLAYTLKGMYPEALDDLTAVMKLEPNFGSDFGQRGIIAYHHGQWTQAAEDFRSALRLHSWNDEAMAFFLWMSRCRLGERVPATVELRQFAADRPAANPHAAWCLKIISFLLGGTSEADLIAGASAVGTGSLEGHQAEAAFYIATKRLIEGDPAGAREYFRKCADIGVDAEHEINIAKAELARLDGKRDQPLAGVPKAEPAPAVPADPAPAMPAAKAKTAEEAVARGIAALRAIQDKTASFEFADRRMGHVELLLLTLLSAGVPVNDPDVQTLLTELLRGHLETTIGVALQAVVLERIDRVKYQGRLAMCAQFLVDNQTSMGGWSYGSTDIYVEDVILPPAGKRATVIAIEKKRDGSGAEDQVNFFFAVLGLRACRSAGVALPRLVVDLAIRWNRMAQRRPRAPEAPKTKDWYSGDPRGWCYGYHPDHEAYGSATMASVAAQAMLISIWDDDAGKKVSWKREKCIQDGVTWLIQNYSVRYNPGPYEFAKMEQDSRHQYYFYLFALEQAMVLLGLDQPGGRAWYEEGCKALVERQSENGTWGGTAAGPMNVPFDVRRDYATSNVADTCFAILFLKKAGQPLPDMTKPKK